MAGSRVIKPKVLCSIADEENLGLYLNIYNIKDKTLYLKTK